MKKVILTAVAVFAFGFANAQDVKFGVKGGLNIATFSGDVKDNSSIVGFHVGGFTEIKVSEKFSVQPELLYSTQGSKFERYFNSIKTDVQYKLAYLNLPVMAKYYVASKFSLEAGPQIGFLTSAKAVVTALGATADGDVKEQFKSIDFGVNFGAGYDFTENISAGLRYNLGLSNIAKTPEGNDSKLGNNVFSLSLGYKF